MQAGPSHSEYPLVSWLIPTTLYRHRWWKRLVEFLEDDFPAPLSECIILGTQDKDFIARAKILGEEVVQSLASTDLNILEKWKKVRFLEKYTPEFNLSRSRNILLDNAKGHIVIHRDADTALIRRNFTRFAVRRLIESKLGILSFPSLQNGVHFKPGHDLVSKTDARFPHITLTNTANGMTTVLLKSIEMLVGGRNEALPFWGEHTALCTKLASAGFAIGYTDDGYWFASNDDESDISLTDDKRNPRSLFERQVTIAMLNEFYDTQPDDIFWRVQRTRYKVFDDQRTDGVKAMVSNRRQQFNAQQRLPEGLLAFPFKPWNCLSHHLTAKYLERAQTIAAPHFVPIEERWRGIEALGKDRWKSRNHSNTQRATELVSIS